MIATLGLADLFIINDLEEFSPGIYMATGEDPHFEIRNLPDGLVQEISIVLKAENGEFIEIYWTYGEEESYSVDSRSSQIITPNIENTYKFSLNSDKEIKKLRLDPTNAPGKIEIKDIKIFYLPHVLEGVTDETYDLTRYILKFQSHCEKYLAPLCNPRGKSVLVIGAGHGTEMLWCILNGAKEVIGIDVADKNTNALKIALTQMEMINVCDYEMLRMSVEEIDKIGRKFDLVLSNNVFEHLPDINKAFSSCKKMIEPFEGRIVVFTDPLFYSSSGAHIPLLAPWEHLWNNEIKDKTNGYLWQQYKSLNKMRLLDFIKSIECNNLAIIKLNVIPDRNIENIKSYLNLIPCDSITNLVLEGISVELMRIDSD